MIEWIRGLQFMKSKFDLVTGYQEVEIEIFFYLILPDCFQHVLDFFFLLHDNEANLQQALPTVSRTRYTGNSRVNRC